MPRNQSRLALRAMEDFEPAQVGLPRLNVQPTDQFHSMLGISIISTEFPPVTDNRHFLDFIEFMERAYNVGWQVA